MLHPTTYNTAQICHQLGVEHAVMSPGSRNAPLTISFARHDKIKKWIIPDERSAGFIALGLAQASKTPVVLCCTSGTALLNYAPAIAEAYYREIPLIVLSADRPPELIDQRDGQTIRQFEALKNHVKASTELPLIRSEQDAINYQVKLIDTLITSSNLPFGPVHVNIPFEEPFYPTGDEQLAYAKVDMETFETKTNREKPQLPFTNYSKILVLVGQQQSDPLLDNALSEIGSKVPVVKLPLNNLSNGITHVDLFIQQQEELRPELLVTCGLSVLSKKLKLFLKSNKPIKHIHFDPSGISVDTFQTDPEVVPDIVNTFLEQLNVDEIDPSFKKTWDNLEAQTQTLLRAFLNESAFSESSVAAFVLSSLPSHIKLHLSNSMPVRYADMFGIPNGIECYSNRGTSGIDGCTSTAIGTSLITKELNVLITGDLAFLYDRNAFFNNYKTPNLRIIVLNNQGGGIFRLIDGPSKLPELEDYFETRHNRTSEYICAENKLQYLKADNMDALESHMSAFYEPSDTAKVMEVFTNPETNQSVYKKLKAYINERIKNRMD